MPSGKIYRRPRSSGSDAHQTGRDLPTSLVEALVQLGHDADSVQQEGLQGSPNAGVWAAAQADKRFLVTQDLDFSDLRQFAPGTHHGLLLVRLADPGRRVLKA
ncbi:DUF5615 family PIN-like protein [Sorangium sp. So ce1014]|uniref:DUF5615 family PIN-like protein n=1 Tax=Sorangium sp. So ce1014 TaxID=3133326 RepID=UPI003F5F8CB4